MDMEQDGWTPLHIAANNNRCDVILYLICLRGVSMENRSNQDETPLHIASKKGNTRVVLLLLLAGARSDVISKVYSHTVCSKRLAVVHIIVDLVVRWTVRDIEWEVSSRCRE